METEAEEKTSAENDQPERSSPDEHEVTPETEAVVPTSSDVESTEPPLVEGGPAQQPEEVTEESPQDEIPSPIDSKLKVQEGQLEETGKVMEDISKEPIPLAADASLPATAREIAFTRAAVDLLKFVRLTDFVPCDYNQDGVVDVLALNSRLSTGYGYSGIGNGVFTEGPSFDLPFRPAAATPLGDSGNATNGLFLVSAAGTVSIFYPLLEDDPSMTAKASSFSVFRVDTVGGPVFVVHGDGKSSVHVYLLINGGLQDKGEYSAWRTSVITDWYNGITTWDSLDEQEPFPLPPTGMEKTARIGDLNDDFIPDLVYYDSGKVIYLLSRDGEALIEEQTVSCYSKPAALRLADVDGNDFLDVLALMTSGTLEVYLIRPE